MSRPIRIEYPGATYYITSRVPPSQQAFCDERDRIRFLDILSQTIKRSGWVCHAWCLMDDHYHLIIETPKANLSQGMRQVNGIYTQEYNRRYFKKGALFKGRFKAILFDKDANLIKLARHLMLNPVRLERCDYASQYRWSSFNEVIGQSGQAKPISARDWLLAQFGENPADAINRFQDYVNKGSDPENPWRAVRYQLFLGNATFVEKHRQYMDKDSAPSPETRTPLSDLFDSNTRKDRSERDRTICDAHLRHGYTLTELGQHLGLHTSTVSKILKKQGV
ncbi:MAG: transposase [Gammaproteobacteria bacterium]|nr:transposase [Gammaproteobacteria bacterium]